MSLKESEKILAEIIDKEGIFVTLQLISSVCENNEHRSPVFWQRVKRELDTLVEKARLF